MMHGPHLAKCLGGEVWVLALAGHIGLCSLSKTLYSHGASLHPGVRMGTREYNAGG